MSAPLVTVARYQEITGDTTTAASAVSARIEDATDLLEAELGGRLLRSEERTEQMYRDRLGRLYPRALPITDGGTYTVDGATLRGGSPLAWPDIITDPFDSVAVTYTGGYVERTANPTAANRLPVYVEYDIAWAAYQLLHPSAATALVSIPAGASSASLGDASVSSSSGALSVGMTAVVDGIWSRDTLRLRRTRIGLGIS